MGPTLLIAKSEDFIFGGYSDKNWKSIEKFQKSRNSFLFSLKYEKKSKIFRNQEKALYYNKNFGPCFGEDLMIVDEC